ncbi:hypothetical protein JCM3774_005733 [Rhodotorula dairenensis]
MPPLKLPPKKPKGKGKAKQLHIDYATPDSARASAPADWTAEHWLEEGTRQEEQGERYQVGPKAARHLANATTCYRLAATLSPTDFDARYNAARVCHTLGSDHLAPPDCLEALQAARTGYREALAVLNGGTSLSGEVTARIDALYNLAQADTTLLAQLAEAIVPRGPDQVELETELAQEARQLFLEVERLQRGELDRYGAVAGIGAPAADESLEIEAEDDVDDGTETSVQVTETTIVTPRLVIDTLLASISFYIQLSESALVAGADDAQLRQSAVDAFSRAVELRNVVAAQERTLAELADLDLELAIAQVEIFATWSPAEAGPKLDEMLAAAAAGGTAGSQQVPARIIDLLSLHADSLVESFTTRSSAWAAGEAAVPESLERALAAYRRAASLLANRLSPPKHIPALQLAPLLSANLASQAHVHLLVAATYLGSTPSSHDSPSRSLAALDEAQRLALEAIAAAKPAVVLSAASPGASFSTATPGQLPTISAVRPTGSVQDPRTDWATVAAVRTAFFTLLRVRYYACAALAQLGPGSIDPDALREGGIRSRAWADWNALGLEHGRAAEGSTASLRRSEVEWWLDETDGDAVTLAVGEHAARAEREWWIRLASS